MTDDDIADTVDTASVAASALSITSTEMFQHEPFITFRYDSRSFCKKNWPHLAASAFKITLMEGGSYNHVVRLTVDVSKTRFTRFQRHAKQLFNFLCHKTRSSNTARSYIVRMPRFEHAWFEYEVAILLYLAKTAVPAPLIQSFDLSSANPLESRYTVQHLLPGRSVQEFYLDLNTAQCVSFARSLGNALRNLHPTSPMPTSKRHASTIQRDTHTLYHDVRVRFHHVADLLSTCVRYIAIALPNQHLG
jgi:hypothetical protein